jgi:tetratricopeptide (TPR) repeat protein
MAYSPLVDADRSTLLGAAYLDWLAGESTIALLQFEECQKLSAQLGDMLTYGSALFMIGAIKILVTPRNAGDGVEGHRFLEQLDQAFAILQNAGAPALWELGVLSLARCLISFEFDALDGAQQYADAGMEIFRRLGQPYGIGLAFNYQGDVARLRGDHALAATRYQAGLPLLRQANARSEIPAVLHNLAYSLLAQGDMLHARRLFTEGLVLHGEVGNRMGMAECLIGLATIAMDQNEAQDAATLLGATDALLAAFNVPLYKADQSVYQHLTERVREEIGTAQWEAAQMAGREMPLAELITSAQLSPGN